MPVPIIPNFYNDRFELIMIISSIRWQLLSFLLIFMAASAEAAVHGRVNMKGSIIDMACAINIDSQYQSIKMPTVPASTIAHNGKGPDVEFVIQLVNCSLTPWHSDRPNWSTLRITFDGEADDSESFHLSGNARGMSLQLADSIGNTAHPGVMMPPQPLQAGSRTLNYVMRLVSNRESVRVGDYYTTLRFKLDYF